MANIKFVAVSRGLSGIVDYVTNREKTTDKLITGVNCVARTAVHEFEAVKKQFHKTDGRAYYHIVQAFAPDDPVDFETVHQIGLEFAAHFKGYQCLVATHMNTKHKHNHIIMNSVNFETGMKFHQSAKEMRMVKEFNNELCRKYGLSITETKADPFHVPKWKDELKAAIRQAMECSNTREEFMAEMESMGYGVKWEPNQKYITYTTPDNIRCRDNKLFDQTLLRGNMELYFAMGGAAYLEQRRDAAEYGEQVPTVDDAVYGVASIFDAMLTGDNDRFHLETVHHSDREIQMLLRMGKKLERIVRVVDDDEEQQKKRHDPAKELYYASLLLGDLLRTERKHRQEQEDDYEYSDMDENSIQQEIADDPYAAYDEEPEEELEEEQDMEYQQYHGFGFGGMGGMSM